MFKRILVPVDMTEKNRTAVDMAYEMALQSDAQVVLLHVIETVEHIAFKEFEEFYARLERSAREGMNELSAKFKQEEVPVDTVVQYGRRADEIVSYAIDTGVDLIIMSSHRVDPDRPGAGFSSISYKVAILAPCPVLLVK